MFLVTHSPYLVTSDFQRVFFVKKENGGYTSVANLSEVFQEILNGTHANLLKRKFENPRVRAGLFSKLIVIFEGDSEEAAIPAMLKALGA